MNERAPCSGCGARLAGDQHYCVECGARVSPPLALPYLAQPPGAQKAVGAFVLPMPLQMATTCAALALGFGVVVGTAISPNLSSIIAGPPPAVVEAPPPPEPAPPPPPAPAGGGGTTTATADAPVTTASTTPTGGGGGGKKKKKKPQPDTFPVDGWVVQVNPTAVSFTVAKLDGSSPVTVHTDRVDQLPSPTTGIVTKARRMFNDTLREVGPRTLQGSSSTVKFSGTVAYRDLGDPTDPTNTLEPTDEEAFTVATPGASLLVRIPIDGSSPLASEVDPPPLGAQVEVPVDIRSVATLGNPLELTPAPTAPTGCPPPATPFKPSPGPTHVLELAAGMGSPSSTDLPGASIAAIVQANCAGGGKTLFSADGIRERGVDQELTVPSGIDISKYLPGQAVVANIALKPPGTPAEITGIAGDQGVTGARDHLLGQGDMAGPPVDDVGTAGKKRKKKKRRK